MNNKSIMDMARQLGLPVTEANIEDVSSMSRQQMEDEIRKLRNEIKKDPETFRKQVAAIKSLSAMMNPAQRAKLESLLRMLEE
jgi:beta-phosphoglucomutase-like phosphatase (HAD superfamily)